MHGLWEIVSVDVGARPWAFVVLTISLGNRYTRGFSGGHGCCSGGVMAGDGCRRVAGW